ncbi:MAG: hypothetical protein KC561_02625 [Myxococcales bacterium]|nr:hypothetical protein [Myxococcales bacterium]
MMNSRLFLTVFAMHLFSWAGLANSQGDPAEPSAGPSAELSIDALAAALTDALRSDDTPTALELALELVDAGSDRLVVTAANQLGASGNFARETAFLESVLAARPEAFNVAFQLGTYAQTYRRYEEAIGFFERVGSSAGGTYRFAQLNTGASLRALGRLDEASSIYESLEGDGRTGPFISDALCQIELARGEIDACASRLTEAKARYGDAPVLGYTEALLLYHQGQFERLGSTLTELPLVGDTPRVAMLAALVALENRENDTALAALDQVRVVAVTGHITLVRAMASADGSDEQRTLLAEAIELNPLFSDPEATARATLWRGSITDRLRNLLLAYEYTNEEVPAGTGDGSGAAAPTPAVSNEEPPAANDSSGGCCSTVQRDPDWMSLFLGLLLFLPTSFRGLRGWRGRHN